MGWRLQSCLAPLGGVDELYIYIYIFAIPLSCVSDLCLRPHPFGPRETAMGEDSGGAELVPRFVVLCFPSLSPRGPQVTHFKVDQICWPRG